MTLLTDSRTLSPEVDLRALCDEAGHLVVGQVVPDPLVELLQVRKVGNLSAASSCGTYRGAVLPAYVT
eukprot:5551226-Pyramimonas_sp.AAC.1